MILTTLAYVLGGLTLGFILFLFWLVFFERY
jgi:hypothetical protein